MNKKNALMVAAILSILNARGHASSVSLPAEGFDLEVGRALARFSPQDAFSTLPSCGLDKRFFIAPSLQEAAQEIKPCLAEVSRRYSAKVVVKLGPVEGAGRRDAGLLILADSSDALRDLNHSLKLRGGLVYGHPAKAKRAMTRREVSALDSGELAAPSALQEVVESCIIPTVVRKIESGKDFISIYGRCVLGAKSLKVKEIQASEGHKLAVNLLSLADRPVLESLNGVVTVNTGHGPVELLVVAYPEIVERP